MKHIFVINPIAGKKDATEDVKKKALFALDKDDCEFYVTKSSGDAVTFVKEYIENHPDEQLRFYACGGDGTLHEVAQACVNKENVEVTCVPCGSGNDFVKYYGGKECFEDFDSLVNGTPHKIDVLKVTDSENVHYCINIDNFGFDAFVCDTMNHLKGHPIFGGSAGYLVGVVKGLGKAMKTDVQVIADGEVMTKDNEIMLATVSNCHYVGGMFFVAPNAKNDDGLIDVTVIDPLSRAKFMKLVMPYTKGEIFTNPIFNGIYRYKQAKKVEISAPEGFINCIDGEIINHNKFTIEVVPGALNFVIPLDATKNNPKN
ncbi:MAG TPA: hypothetical protein GXZ23_01000 [Clostridiales bacterium]|jgi:diacylglycerol kinase (ATP)|nr:hypothetical protein [Clostridiales bacterium]